MRAEVNLGVSSSTSFSYFLSDFLLKSACITYVNSLVPLFAYPVQACQAAAYLTFFFDLEGALIDNDKVFILLKREVKTSVYKRL